MASATTTLGNIPHASTIATAASSSPSLSSSPSAAPRVVGLYGIPGCGKSFMMNELKKDLGQETEIQELRGLCYANNILFAKLYPNMREKLLNLLLDTQRYDEEHKQTLSAEDTGTLFWDTVNRPDDEHPGSAPLKVLFGSNMGYSYEAFRQAMLLYEESTSDAKFETICDEIAQRAPLYPQMITFLNRVAENRHIRPEKIIAWQGLSKTVQVVGGGRLADGYVVIASVKKALVARAKDVHRVLRVIAFGDSSLDLPMLKAADQAFVVVGEEATRSKSMDRELPSAMVNDGLRAQQSLLPNSSTPPRLDTIQLPIADFESTDFLNSIIAPCALVRSLQVHHATHSTAAKLHGEGQTLIVALIRGGEPMAFGINDVFPKAQFLHAAKPEDVKQHHLEGNSTIILVDSVINNGDTVAKFIQFILTSDTTIRIIVVAGVVQEKAVALGSPLCCAAPLREQIYRPWRNRHRQSPV
ncbi:uncharacterized protein DSM5745_06537 [Aspergillus mulundensis]|uniref:Phosphoribosyltransferase domain-containing protein n=1 Tax=Aspergillus mulundensis TaxID=1810919 RepID=A0A3D8RRA8_9EURO|nr:hypothetical protein DSM5745_06537 [Aspergillus mulundensis]RDW76545.1 hypothetical protein DSM5745_06537 [Aspergillus mulundensis]